MKKISFFLLVFFLIIGCNDVEVKDDAVRLGVSFSFNQKHRCTEISPAIHITGVPAGTVKFRVKLVDLDITSYNHGGGTVQNDGSGIIEEGALKSGYTGPCPPSGSHRYKFIVYSLDENNDAIGVGESIRRFPY